MDERTYNKSTWQEHSLQFVKIWLKGSGCGSVGKAVASNTRGLRFESSHLQILMNLYFLLTVYRKDENKKRPGMTHFETNMA